jgi:hypothetical protein
MGAGAMMDQKKLPPLPPGFQIEDNTGDASASAAMPALPPGFQLETPQDGLQAAPAASMAPSGPTTPSAAPATPEAAPVQAAGDPNVFDALGYSLSQGMTFGLGDELAAGLRTGFGTLGNYGQALDQERANLKAVQDKYPWLSFGGELAGGAATGGGLAKSGLSAAGAIARNGGGWLARMLAGAGEGGIMSGLYGFGTGENGFQNRIAKGEHLLPYGIGLGAAGEGLATGGGALYNRLFHGAGDVAPGVNPAANVSDAQQFGIPLSRAQATRSVSQANIENGLRSQGSMSAFDQAQNDAVASSVGNVQSRLAAGNQNIPGAASAYDTIPARLRGIRQDLKSASQDAYAASVDNPNVLVSGDAVKELPDFIRNRLSSDNIIIDPMYHTGAARALNFIDDYLGRLPSVAKPGDSATPMLSGPAGEVKAVDAQLRWIENLRAAFRKNFPPIGQDAPALKAIRSALDDWTGSVFDRGLVTADDDTLRALKDARSKWSSYMAMADPKARIGGKLNPQYEAQRALRYISDKNLSPEEVGNYLWGYSVAAPKNTSVMTAQLLKKTLGPDSPEWNAIRQSFWLRATRAGDDTLSPNRIAKNLDGLLIGQGNGVAKTLYSPAELDMMRKYAGVMRNLQPPRQGLNNSNTANRLMPMLKRYGAAIVGSLAGGGTLAHGGDPMTSLGIGAATTTGLGAMNALSQATRAATATRVPVPPVPTGVGPGMLRGALATGTGMIDDRLAKGLPRTPLELTVTPRDKLLRSVP